MLQRSRTLLTVLGLAAALAACGDYDDEPRGDSAVVEFAPEPSSQPVAPEPEAAPAPEAAPESADGLPEGPIPYDQLKEQGPQAPAPQKSDENIFY